MIIPVFCIETVELISYIITACIQISNIYYKTFLAHHVPINDTHLRQNTDDDDDDDIDDSHNRHHPANHLH
jgi:hypothetical protein